MYHCPRVCRLHVLECVMDTTISLVKRQQLEEASNVLLLFPRLQPLVAAVGWDLLPGNTSARRNLIQLLWTGKLQVIRLEESTLYGCQSDEVSCVENLCDSLCYQLDLASFVACVNYGHTWSSNSSLLSFGKDDTASMSENADLDPFVENFVLERLSAQSFSVDKTISWNLRGTKFCNCTAVSIFDGVVHGVRIIAFQLFFLLLFTIFRNSDY
ncbi:hypothetical protein BT93_G0073 [Corymbia citriodora subsp. variegata]|nr:hypothetical protein BT93_G0073 [Corymbia citriodora subsp. variegata]